MERLLFLQLKSFSFLCFDLLVGEFWDIYRFSPKVQNATKPQSSIAVKEDDVAWLGQYETFSYFAHGKTAFLGLKYFSFLCFDHRYQKKK